MQRSLRTSTLAALIGLAAGCSSTVATLPVVDVTANIVAPTTWTADNVYVVQNSITVSSILTVAPGTIVKLESGVNLTVATTGSIAAVASGASPCVFTSIKDDAHGGDSNADGTASSPARGDWGYLWIRGSGSAFDHCQFLYGGAHEPYDGTVLVTDDALVSFTHCTFAHDQGGTLTDTRAAALHLGGAGAASIVTGNTFFDDDVPVVINGTFDLDASNVFHSTSGSTTVRNTYNGIVWGGTYDVTGDITWSNTEVPYVIVGGPVSVNAGSSLTLADGVVLKLDGQRVDVPGVLIADATTEIVFTSLADDDLLGDTNGDGSLTAALPGDWARLLLQADGSVLHHVRFQYGGASMPYSPTVGIENDAVVSVTDCTFTRNQGGTLADTRAAAFNAGGAGAGTILTGNLFYDNDLPLVVNGLVDLDGSNVFHSSATLNGIQGIVIESGSSVTGNVTWSNTEVAYVVFGSVFSIADTGTLTLGDAVVLKLQNARIDLFGSIAEGAGVYYTSLKDDTLAGDTNMDGSATTPATGDWAGIDMCLGGPCTWASWSNIEYATNP